MIGIDGSQGEGGGHIGSTSDIQAVRETIHVVRSHGMFGGGRRKQWSSTSSCAVSTAHPHRVCQFVSCELKIMHGGDRVFVATAHQGLPPRGLGVPAS